MPPMIWKKFIAIRNKFISSFILFLFIIAMIVLIKPCFDCFFLVIPTVLITYFINSTQNFNLDISFENIIASPLKVYDIIFQEATFILIESYFILTCSFFILAFENISTMPKNLDLVFILGKIIISVFFCKNFAFLSCCINIIFVSKTKKIIARNIFSSITIALALLVDFRFKYLLFLLTAIIFYILCFIIKQKFDKTNMLKMENR